MSPVRPGGVHDSWSPIWTASRRRYERGNSLAGCWFGHNGGTAHGEWRGLRFTLPTGSNRTHRHGGSPGNFALCPVAPVAGPTGEHPRHRDTFKGPSPRGRLSRPGGELVRWKTYARVAAPFSTRRITLGYRPHGGRPCSGHWPHQSSRTRHEWTVVRGAPDTHCRESETPASWSCRRVTW